tara:strand:- start:298 stop:471 length:174 start_codon:yes stop_codon:yes gene_type:complete
MKRGDLIWVKLPHMVEKSAATVIDNAFELSAGGKWVDVLIGGKIKGIHSDFVIAKVC